MTGITNRSSRVAGMKQRRSVGGLDGSHDIVTSRLAQSTHLAHVAHLAQINAKTGLFPFYAVSRGGIGDWGLGAAGPERNHGFHRASSAGSEGIPGPCQVVQNHRSTEASSVGSEGILGPWQVVQNHRSTEQARRGAKES